MKTFVSEGRTLRVVAAANVLSGDAVVAGGLLGIAHDDALATKNVVLALDGVYAIPKADAATYTVGDPVNFDISTGNINNGVPAAGDLVGVGNAMETKGATTAGTVLVRLAPGNATVT